MIEKDTLQELFSKAFENQTASVRPELWAGVQAKMGVAAGASVAAAKGVSVLTKWIIGAASVSVVGVVTTLVVTSNPVPSSANQTSANSTNKTEKTEDVLHKNPASIESKQISSAPSLFVQPKDVTTKIEQEQTFETIQHEQIYTPEIVFLDLSTEPDMRLYSQNSTVNNENKPFSPVVSQKDTPIVFPETSEPVVAPIRAKAIRFPNVFTPNGDGYNDFYFIEAENVSDVTVEIMNSNNQVVFRSNDIRFKWDGQFAGERVPTGMYACVVVGKDANQKEFRDIQLIEIR